MTKYIFVIGLPGSGKTEAFKNKETVLDDEENSYCALVSLMKENKAEIYLLSAEFCDEQVLQSVVKFIEEFDSNSPEFEYVYYENNPTQCIKNVINRNDGRNVLADISALSKIYNPPRIDLNVWRLEEW